MATMVNFPRISRLLFFFFLILSAFLWSLPALAQATFKAQLRGTVSDSTGAIVRDATVTLTNQATAVSSTVKTDADGRYIFNNLTPASYDVQVEASGFKATRQTNVVLRVGQQSELDLKLDVGAVSASVVVTGDPVLLNSASPELGQ